MGHATVAAAKAAATVALVVATVGEGEVAAMNAAEEVGAGVAKQVTRLPR